MITRSYWLCSIAVLALMGGLARPAQATKQYNLAMGAGCQPANLVGVIAPVTYTTGGIMVDGLVPIDLICPIAWSKQLGLTWQTLATMDIQVDWLGLPPGLPITNTPTWGCSLVYQTAGGSVTTQGLPIPNPIPAGLVNVAYAALLCTVPASMGIQGYQVNMCFVNPLNPAGC